MGHVGEEGQLGRHEFKREEGSNGNGNTTSEQQKKQRPAGRPPASSFPGDGAHQANPQNDGPNDGQAGRSTTVDDMIANKKLVVLCVVVETGF